MVTGGLAAGFQARWIVFEFEAEVTVAPPVGDQPVLGAVALHDLEVYTLQELKNILGPEVLMLRTTQRKDVSLHQYFVPA
jgi:hypothetical protein